MTNGAYKNISGLTHELEVTLWDYNDDGEAVWRINVAGEARYIEARVDADAWEILEKGLHAYDEN